MPQVTLQRFNGFFEATGESAAILSTRCGVTLRSHAGQPYAAFPFHQVNGYRAKLQREGFVVVVLDINGNAV